MQLSTKNSKDLTAREIFRINLEFMAGAYPGRNIELQHTNFGDIVVIDGEQKFNTDGYCLLDNLKRLCKCLENGLL